LNNGKDELKTEDLGPHVDGVEHTILASTETSNVGPRRGVWNLFLTKLANTLKYHKCIVKVAFCFVRIFDFLVLFIELVRLHSNEHPKKFLFALKSTHWISRVLAI
jgi:hypothetical protein